MRYSIFFLLVLHAIWAQTDSTPIKTELPSAESKLFWKYHHLAALGYRRDRQQFHESNSTMRIEGRNSLELILRSHVELGHFVAYLQGNYGWLLNGDFAYAANGNPFGEPVAFRNDLGAGYSADAAAALGLNFKLIDCPKIAISLIPSGGYKYSHLMNFAEGEDRFGIGARSFALGRFPTPNQQDWFGPYAEGRLKGLFWEDFEWSIFYQYHRPALRSKSKEEIDFYLFNAQGAATAIDLFRTTAVYRVRSAVKQLIGTNFRYHGSSGWNFGIQFEGSKTESHKARYIAKRSREQFILAPTGVTVIEIDTTASLRWVCYEASIYLGYQF